MTEGGRIGRAAEILARETAKRLAPLRGERNGSPPRDEDFLSLSLSLSRKFSRGIFPGNFLGKREKFPPREKQARSRARFFFGAGGNQDINVVYVLPKVLSTYNAKFNIKRELEWSLPTSDDGLTSPELKRVYSGR